MAIKTLPVTVTKEVLLHAVQDRLMQCTKMFWDPDTTVQQMYEDLSCSVFSGDPDFDFPELVVPAPTVIRYHYNKGSCSFMVDGIEVEVLDLRGMRNDPDLEFERYADVCIPSISYTDSDGNFMYHPIPNAWLYGSTSDDFSKGKPVHEEFIKAAREYIKEHNITPELQEYLE